MIRPATLVLAAFALVAIAAPSAAATNAPGTKAASSKAKPLTSASAVLAAIQNGMRGLKSYAVPLTMKGSVKVSFISLPFNMSGDEYYQSPDKYALRMRNVPHLAQQFANQVGTLGSPETWPRTYAITLRGREQRNKHEAYVLVGVPRAGGNVKDVTFWVNAASFAIDYVTFAYKNGAAVELSLVHHNKSPYHLPMAASVEARFPGYSGNATIAYGSYKTNVPIDAAIFKK